MISASFPELFVSLTLQCSVVLMVALAMTRRAGSSAMADRIWAHTHVAILLLCLVGCLLPHLRVLQPDSVLIGIGQFAGGGIFQALFRVVAGVWIAGVAVLSAGTINQLIQTHRLVRRCCIHQRFTRERADAVGLPVADDHWSSDTREMLESLNATVVWSSETTTPFCWQLHAPVIVLPEAIDNFPTQELDAVLRHELAHLGAQHPLRLFLQRLLEIGFWFHPLVWMSSREASLQRELASDLLANRSIGQATTFLSGMVRLAELCSSRTRTLVAGLSFSGAGRSMIQKRVDQILARDWSTDQPPIVSLSMHHRITLAATTLVAFLLWIPLNPEATGRTVLSPWPRVTAAALHEAGVEVRDYEVDRHRLYEHHQTRFR